MISVLLSARPSYAKLQPVIAEFVRRQMSVEIVACASALLTRYGHVAEVAAHDFPDVPMTRIPSTLEGATLQTDAKETGVLLASLADHYARARPQVVMVCADRHETLAASMAAAYQNIPVAHLQGGERSGNIDDQVRAANSALAIVHFPATMNAALRLQSRVPAPDQVYCVGCPSIDVAAQILTEPPLTRLAVFGGVGPDIDLQRPFLLIAQHPETEQPEMAYEQMVMTLEACRAIPLPRVVLWPGQDAGQEGGAKAIREALRDHPADTFHVIRGIPPRAFLQLVNQAVCLVGNSSVGIREASYLGTPGVNIGTRQCFRERGDNTVTTPWHMEKIRVAILDQCDVRRFPSSALYGNGEAARRIADVLQQGLP